MSEPVVIVQPKVNNVVVTPKAANKVVVQTPGPQGPPPNLTDNVLQLAIGYGFDGGGVDISTGLKGWVRVPLDCTIEDWEIVADHNGSIVIDVWKASYAEMNLPVAPTNADSITGGAKPTVSAGNKATDKTLAGWSKDIAAGDYLCFHVDSCSGITRCSISLKAIKAN